MAVETDQNGNVTTITGEDIDFMALITAQKAMEVHVESGGRMRLTRIATPAYIAARFNLIDPKSKKAPKTAKACLRILNKMVEDAKKKRGSDPESMSRAAVLPVTDSPSSLN